jgi:UDP-N-acetylglucosamine--N-acetylmuramyl-(pentapeptide) pyrophosphoryl-undecaprenol N-acetylglucosamine transferase
MLSGRATKVFTAFAATNRWLKRTDNVELVGTPTRDSLGSVSKESGMQFFGLDVQKQTVLVFGGSLGASSINRAIAQSVDDFVEQGIQLIWQTGEGGFLEIKELNARKHIGWVGAFIDRMDCAYAAADIVVSRSGATTIAELTRLGKPAVLVPYPLAAADHQTLNAMSTAEAGAAEVVADNDMSTDLRNKILALLKDQARMETMSKASKTLGKADAGKVIAEYILGFVKA